MLDKMLMIKKLVVSLLNTEDFTILSHSAQQSRFQALGVPQNIIRECMSKANNNM